MDADELDRRAWISEEILKLLPDSIAVCDRDGRVIYVNASAERIFGRGAGCMLGRVIWDLFPGAMSKAFYEAFQRVVAGGRPERFDHHHAPWDLWFENHLYPMGDGLCVIGRDITERKRAEQRRQDSEHRFRVMADSAPVLIWMTDPDGRIQYLNSRCHEFAGAPREELLGLGGMSRLHPDDEASEVAAWQEAFSARAPFENTSRWLSGDGEYRWMLAVGIPLFDAGGGFEGYIGTAVDVTASKRAEEERESLLSSERAARSEAERANRMKDEFLATLSHELRTPLNAIVGWAQMLRNSRLDPASVERGVEVIDRNARLLAQLVADLLDMSRITSGKLRLDVQPVDPQAIIDASVESVQRAADAKDIAIVRRSGGPREPLLADGGRIQQVVWNLLSNAIKFTPRGGRVEVALERGDASVEISVSDTGRGIRPDFLPHLFERFRQADPATTRHHGGLGLGLSICRHLVELHGGTVRAESPGEGHGATFTVALPAAAPRDGPADAAPRAPRSPPPPAPFEATSLAGVRILVVDDEPDARDVVQRILGEYGAEVIAAGSAAQALEMLLQRPPDVLVSDIGMPEVDGYDLMRRVRALPLDKGGAVPAVALTAFARPEDRARAERAGYQAHVAKPVEGTELCATIARAAGLRNSQPAGGAGRPAPR